MPQQSRTYLQSAIISAVSKVKSLSITGIATESDLVYDLNMDSLELQEMVIMLEEDYGITIQDQDLVEVRTISQLIERWHQRRGMMLSSVE